MNIELHIERLILDGLQVEPRNRAALQAAVEAELTRLLTAGGLRAELLSGGAVRSLGAGEIQVTNQTSAAHLGNHIAQAVHSGISADGAGQRHGSAAANGMSRTLSGKPSTR
jgi:hypothetical protein